MSAPPAPLVPWSSPAGGAPGWKILLPAADAARRAAAALGGDVQPASDGRWPVILRREVLHVTALSRAGDTLAVSLPGMPGMLHVRLRECTGLAAVECQSLPAEGTITVRQLLVETRMGRVLQGLVPVFRAGGRDDG